MNRRGFTLVELLVAISIILLLVTLASVAASAARASARATATLSLLERLDSVLREHIAVCETRPVDMSNRPPNISASAHRAWFIRRNLITGDMPDRWTDVKHMAENPADFKTPAQQAYIALWQSLTPAQRADSGPDSVAVMRSYASAECLFMVVMRGGLADCLQCGSVSGSGSSEPRIGDTDQDGMPEFLDAWGNPIGYLLWAPALELPASTKQRFFSGSRTLDPAFPVAGGIRATLGMRPLLYSTGPDEKSGLERNNEASTLAMGTDCGNPLGPGAAAGGPVKDPVEAATRLDNVTNLDDEAKR